MSGALDGGLITYDQLVGQVAKGDTMRTVMPLDFSDGGDAVVASVDIKDIPSIKGQKVAYAPLSPSDFLLAFALRKHGLKDSDVQSVGAGPEAVPSAMASGQVKVGVTYEPMVSQITSMEGGKKFHVIYSSRQAPGLLSDVLVFTDKAMKTRPEVVRAVMRGYLDALEMIRTKPNEAAKVIGKALGISEAEEIFLLLRADPRLHPRRQVHRGGCGRRAGCTRFYRIGHRCRAARHEHQTGRYGIG